jgi:hypothetical protein
MSNIRAIRGVDKSVNINQGGGSKLQGVPSTTTLNTWSHVAFRNRSIVCPCNRNVIFCMNQLGGVGSGGTPGRSYMFAPTADGVRNKEYCGYEFAVPLRKLKPGDRIFLATKGNKQLLIKESQQDKFISDGYSVVFKYTFTSF